jgi:hypothetical protein
MPPGVVKSPPPRWHKPLLVQYSLPSVLEDFSRTTSSSLRAASARRAAATPGPATGSASAQVVLFSLSIDW